jgi:NUDIX domain
MRLCAGGILVRGHEILLATRSSDRAFYPGVWDIVGGHFEADELPGDALTRGFMKSSAFGPSPLRRSMFSASRSPTSTARLDTTSLPSRRGVGLRN